MAEKVMLPLDDTSDDTVMRLSAAEASALYTLLSKLTLNEMMAKGLTREQALMVCDVIHVCY